MSKENDREISGLNEMMEHVPGGIHCCKQDEFFTMLHMSRSFLSMFGYTRDEIRSLFQDRYLLMIYPDDRAPVMEMIGRQLVVGDIMELEYRVRQKSGAYIWVLDKGKKVRMAEGELLYCMLVDITKRKQEQEELRLSLERHQIIMDQTQDIIFEWDLVKDHLRLSHNWNKKFGYTAVGNAASVKSLQSSNLHPEDLAAVKQMQDRIREGTPFLETEFRIKDIRSKYTWCRIRSTTQFDCNGVPVKAIGVIVDIQAEKERRQKLLTLAETDALTGLYHKQATQDKIEWYLRQFTGKQTHALLIVDLDNFKQVNDRYGHLCGDVVLSSAARHIREIFRDSDIVGRIGGDEFMIFCPEVRDVGAVEKRAEEIVAAIRQISVKEGDLCFLTCSIGIAFYPSDAERFTGLYQCADQALYQAKKKGKNGFSRFAPSERLSVRNTMPRIRTEIESEAFADVNQTLAQYFFRVLYQSFDVETVIEQSMEIVGRAYDVSRVYIFENSPDDRFCRNTFEWCNKGVSPEIQNLQRLSYETDLAGFYECFDERGVFCCLDIEMLPQNLCDCLKQQGIVSVLQCAILEGGRFRGYVGFDECRTCRSWTREQVDSLILISNVLSTFLMKLRYKERLAELENRR